MFKNNFFSNLNFSKIFGFAIFALSLLILLFILFRKYYFYQGVEIPYIKAYYFLNFLGFILSIIVFKLPGDISKKLFIIFSSIAITIYIIEYSINYINFKDAYRISLAEKYRVNYDKRTIFEVFKDLKKENSKVSIAFPTAGYVPPGGIKINDNNIFPLGGISYSKTVVCNETGHWSTYFSDRYGFNNLDTLWDKKKINILLLGDSYVHGDCVEPKNNIAGQLRLNSESEVLNLGYRGNSPFMQLATFIEYGLQKKPKHIFWFFSEENDLEEIDRDKNKNILVNYVVGEYDQDLKSKQSDIDENLKAIHNKSIFYRNLKLQNLRLNFINRLVGKAKKTTSATTKYIPKKYNLQIYEQIMERVVEFSKKNNFKVSIVYLPSHARYTGNDYSELVNAIEEISYNLNIVFIDLHKEIFSKKNNPLEYFPFQINSHYTEKAYSEIAEVLLKYLE